jgi:hypothetical protein
MVKELPPDQENDQDSQESNGERRERKDHHPDRFVSECESEQSHAPSLSLTMVIIR